jgi:hypothetical protein
MSQNDDLSFAQRNGPPSEDLALIFDIARDVPRDPRQLSTAEVRYGHCKSPTR